MGRRRKLLKIVIGVSLGVLISQLLFANRAPPGACRRAAPPAEGAPPPRLAGRRLLFVGVMTAAQYLETRARAVYDTWGRTVPGGIVFFSSQHSQSAHVPLVGLAGVDDSYPPQRKSFMMLKYMHDHYIDQYEWFMRADDDVYVRTDRLEELLRSVDSRKAWFIGQTGRGNTEEFGLLSLESDENFCMGGPGVIFSRETLRRIAPFVHRCLDNLYTTHEDVELGRCVHRYAGISCTWSYEMQVILYHNQSGSNAFSGDLKQKEVHRAITMHPVKKPDYMHRLHKYVKELTIQTLQQESINLHRDIAASMGELGFRRNKLAQVELVAGLPLFPAAKGTPHYLGDTNILGVPQGLNRHKPDTVEDVLEWELIAKTLYSHKDLNPRRRIGSSIKEGLSDIVRDIMELINSYSKQRGRVIDFKEILYGYWRLNPVYGVDLILDLLLVYRKYRGHKMTVQVRRHAYVQQTFTEIAVREVDPDEFVYGSHNTNSNIDIIPVHKQIVNKILSTFEEKLQPILFSANTFKNKAINFILPLSGRYDVFRRFLKMYEYVCINEQEETKLFIVLYRNNQDFNRTLLFIEETQKRYIDNGIEVIVVDEEFARAKALNYGIEMLTDNDLMVFIDVDIIFDSNTLCRFRRNTIQSKTIYFPIVFSLYNPKLLNKTYPTDDYFYYRQNFIEQDNGFWRQFGFGIASLYKTDYNTLGGFNLDISGWGFEDVTFYDSAIKSNLKIIRSVDPSLIHVHHSINCDNNLDIAQKNMCLGTQSSTLGSLNQLQKLVKKYKYLLVY